MIAGVRIFAIFGLFAVAVPTLAGERAALEEAWSALYGKSGRDAVATADRVTENYPETSEAWQVLGRAYMRRAGEVNIFRKISRFENSLKAYERAAELDPGNMEAQLALLTVYTMLPKSMGGGEERATAQLQVMAQAVPGLDELGRALQVKVEEDEEQAFAAMLRAIETNPDEPRFRVNLIQHYSDMADWDEAWRALDEARADFPDDIRLQRRGAQLAGESGQRIDDGLAMLEEIASRDDLPGRFRPEELFLLRGRIKQSQGHVEEALSDYRRAKETAPYLVAEKGFSDEIKKLKRRAGN